MQISGKFIKKEALTQVFPWKFCEINKNTFFTIHLHWLPFECVFIWIIFCYFEFFHCWLWSCVCLLIKVWIMADVLQILEIPYLANKCSKSTRETLKQDQKSGKKNSRDCVSLLTTCKMSKTFFKCFSGVLWTCEHGLCLVWSFYFYFFCFCFCFLFSWFIFFCQF